MSIQSDILLYQDESLLKTVTRDILLTDSQISFESEKSYEPLYKKTELYERFTYLTFNLVWMFVAAFANVILFVLYTYQKVFDSRYEMKIPTLMTLILCNLLVLIDVCSAIVHAVFKQYAVVKNLRPRSKILTTFDILSILWLIVDLIPSLSKVKACTIIGFLFVTFRLYRAIWFFYIVSNTSGLNTVSMLLQKYGIILFLVVHVFSCIWQSLGCYKCSNQQPDWTSTIEGSIYFENPTPTKWYILCVYYILGCVISVGFGDIHSVQKKEEIISIIAMVTGFMLIVSAFLGAWTSVQVDGYRRHSIFSNRLKLISSLLDHKRISRTLRAQVMNFYYTFWKQRKGIRYAAIFQKLPITIKEQVNLDKFWHALNQTYILKHMPVAHQRAISNVMFTEIYTAGEAIYVQGQDKNSMVYILRGDVKLLSAEDGESPLLTLSSGTCIGEINLFYHFPNPVQLVASSYCIIQRLRKQQFWKTVEVYNRLKRAKTAYRRLNRKIKNAKAKQAKKNINVSLKDDDEDKVTVEKALKSVKNRLITDQPVDFYEGQNKLDGEEKEIEDNYSDLYILSLHQTKLKHSDEIFLHTSWPWILQPYSVLLTIWEYCVCFAILIVTILYPYQISFTREFPSYMMLIGVTIDTIYLFDVVIQIFTAAENENGLVSKVSDIFAIRCRRLSFIVDVLAITPLATVAATFQITKNKRLLVILSLNRLLKLHRVIILLKKLGGSFNVNIAVVRCIKYILYLLVVSYFMGSIFYMLACFDVECLKNSWFNKIKEEDLQTGGRRYVHTFELSLYFALLVISQTGFGDVKPYNMTEVIVGMTFFIIGTLLFCYLVADYSATLILANQSRANYIQMVSVVRKYLLFNRILPSIQDRTNEYLALQWRINTGWYVLKQKSLLYDAPQHLFEAQQSALCLDALKKVPLFQDLEASYINKIAAKTQPLFLPPNETVINSGDIVKEMYIIDRGYCEVVSAVTGKIEKILGPMSYICDFDMLLELPGMYVIRTVTNVQIYKVLYEDIKKALLTSDFEKNVGKYINEVKKSVAGQRLFLTRGTLSYFPLEEEKRCSWFIFPRRKLDPRHIDYERAFKNVGFQKFFKPLLMRRTVMPDGNFLMIWEMIQACRIFLMALCYLIMPLFLAYFPAADVVLESIFGIAGYVDIYIRMHTGYYNNDSILITHPRYTAWHYLSGAFIIDFCGLLPTDYILKLMIYAEDPSAFVKRNKIQNVLRLNRLLQLYRVPGAFSYFERDLLKRKGFILNILKVLPVTIVFFSAFVSILINVSCIMLRGKNGHMKIIPDKNSWIMHKKDKFSFDVTQPINLYITAYYWIMSTALSLGFGDITAQAVLEMYLTILVIVSGYLLFTYVLVIISSGKANINTNLTEYQDHMKHLIKYMKQEKIEENLQLKVINHFEYIWQRTHGLKASDILKKCHLALREDLVLNLYEHTFEKVPIFQEASKYFYRKLGMNVEEAYYLRDSIIIRLNDIIYNMYIIHKGEVTVIAPDGSVFATLTRGSLFGNIDDNQSSRSMTTVVASKAVDLLCINTLKFYSLAATYPTIIRKLQKHVVLENLSYVSRKHVAQEIAADSSVKVDILKKLPLKEKLKIKRLLVLISLPLPIMVSSFLSCIVVVYHLAFLRHSYMLFIITYTCDLVHLIRLYAGFYIPYQNKMGELITDPEKIKKRFLTFSRFYLELTAVLPIELFSIIAPVQSRFYYLAWLRINRMLRMWNIYHLFNVTFDRLNINMLVTKLGSISVYFILISHIGACLLYIIACPAGKCAKNSWIYNEKGEMKCSSHYLCSLYNMITILTFTGFGDLTPKTILEIIICTIIMFLAKFVMAVFVSDITAIVQNYSYTLVNYDYNKANLKEYLKCNDISVPLINRIMNYVDQLWDKERGHQFPVLLKEAPSYLVEDVKAAAYGKHLYENYVFVSCHIDFLRLLIAKLKVYTYFKNDIICQQGDINNTMYFIHKGYVNVYTIDGHEETQIDQLQELDCFGLVQGLFASTPHSHTFKAATITVILSLHLQNWVYLLYFYRAARYDIYGRIQHMADIEYH